MNSIKVPLLEDDPDDRFITGAILEELQYKVSLKFITHSDELFAELEKELPQMVLVDYNSRSDNGLKVLQRIRSNEQLKYLPVVILGDSASPNYVKDCYANGANSVIKKPDSYTNTEEKISRFFTYWMNVAEL